jgi:CspA family cold shock protein
MSTGKVLQFDTGRGYGFVAADDGGEDIFLHASVFDGDPTELIPGVPLEFQVMAGDRGRKAFAARFAPEPISLPKVSLPQVSLPQVSPPQVSPPQDQSAHPSQKFTAPDEEQMCDVLSQAEFGTELTEVLLKTIPALTGAQILEVRAEMLEFAKKHGWVDG